MMKTADVVKVNVGRVGVAMRGQKGTGVLCWPHAKALKAQDTDHSIVLFSIKATVKPCNVCTQISK